MLVQREKGIKADLPKETIRVGKVTTKAAPRCPLPAQNKTAASRDGFLNERINFSFRGNVVGQGKTGKPRPTWRHPGIFGKGVTPEQGKRHAAGLKEGDSGLAAGGLLPAKGAVKAPAALKIGNAEGDETDGLFHRGLN